MQVAISVRLSTVYLVTCTFYFDYKIMFKLLSFIFLFFFFNFAKNNIYNNVFTDMIRTPELQNTHLLCKTRVYVYTFNVHVYLIYATNFDARVRVYPGGLRVHVHLSAQTEPETLLNTKKRVPYLARKSIFPPLHGKTLNHRICA